MKAHIFKKKGKVPSIHVNSMTFSVYFNRPGIPFTYSKSTAHFASQAIYEFIRTSQSLCLSEKTALLYRFRIELSYSS